MYRSLKYKNLDCIDPKTISIYFNIFSSKMCNFAPNYCHIKNDTKPG